MKFSTIFSPDFVVSIFIITFATNFYSIMTRRKLSLRALPWLLLLLAAVMTACSSGSNKAEITEDEAEIKFDTLAHDYGLMPQDSAVTYEFVFHNIGATPLHLMSVMPTCGCVSVDYPQGSIEPGDAASISATYNTSGRQPGHFNKAIRVYSNAKTKFVRLAVTGTVPEKK